MLLPPWIVAGAYLFFADAATRPSTAPNLAMPSGALASETGAVVNTSNDAAKALLASLPAETVAELHDAGHALLLAPKEGNLYGQAIQAVAIVKKPIGEAYRLVTDPSKQHLFLPGMAESVTVEKTATTELVRFKVQVLFSAFEFYTQHVYDARAYSVEWFLDTRKKNDIVGQKGSWKLYALTPDDTLIFYSTEFDTGFSVPEVLQTFLARTYTKTMLINFRKFVESGGTFRKEQRQESFQ